MSLKPNLNDWKNSSTFFFSPSPRYCLFCIAFFFCLFVLFLFKMKQQNRSRGSASDRWLSALTLYPIQHRFHPIKNHLCTLKLNGSQAAERKKKGSCCVFLSCENQIFLKLPRRRLTGNAATAMTGQGHSHLHTQFNPSQSSWHHINHAFISTAPTAQKKKKKLYFHPAASEWTPPLTRARREEGTGPPHSL